MGVNTLLNSRERLQVFLSRRLRYDGKSAREHADGTIRAITHRIAHARFIMPAQHFATQHEHVALRGQPKSGTTWMEVMLSSVLSACCSASDITAPCYSPRDVEDVYSDPRDMPSVGERNSRSRAVRLKQSDNSSWRSSKIVVMALWAYKHALPVRLAQTSRFDMDLHAQAHILIDRCEGGVSTSLWSDTCLRHVISWPPTLSIARETKFILLLRDPRAVAVSWFHVLLRLGGIELTNAVPMPLAAPPPPPCSFPAPTACLCGSIALAPTSLLPRFSGTVFWTLPHQRNRRTLRRHTRRRRHLPPARRAHALHNFDSSRLL